MLRPMFRLLVAIIVGGGAASPALCADIAAAKASTLSVAPKMTAALTVHTIFVNCIMAFAAPCA